MQQAKILVTLGPSSSTSEQIRSLLEAGARGARLNFSHGTQAEHKARADAVRSVARQLGCEVAILGDLCGPKLRVGRFEQGSVTLAAGALFRLTTKDVPGDATQVTVSYPLHEDLHAGDQLLLDDGLIAMVVEQVAEAALVCRVTVGGILSDHKGVNVPGVHLSTPAVTDKDRQDIQFARGIGVDWLALSFVREAADVTLCKELAGDIPVIAKLEKPEAIEHLEAIISAADGLMVARGDLGVEIGPERVPVIQKRIIELANRKGKLVVTATQMLDSMIHNPRPTRAEASDVANAIFDGSDVVMLSGETAAGKYPLEAVSMMRSIIEQAEKSPQYRSRPAPIVYATEWRSENATARAAATLSRSVKLKALVVLATHSEWLDVLADYRPHAPILALVNDAALARRLALQWGLIPLVVKSPDSQHELIALAEATATATLGAVAGDDIAILAPSLPHQLGHTLTLWKIGAGG
jgi:pyruvate kinase